MNKLFYFDTSIWIDFLENRNDPNFPKGEWVKKLIKNIISDSNKIIFSDNNKIELMEGARKRLI